MPLPGRPGTAVLPMCSTMRSGRRSRIKSETRRATSTAAGSQAWTSAVRRSYGPIGRLLALGFADVLVTAGSVEGQGRLTRDRRWSGRLAHPVANAQDGQMDRAAPLEPELAAGLHGAATSPPGVAYRLLRVLWRVLTACLRLPVTIEGREHLPHDAAGRPVGGWIAAAMPHRTWIDPFVPWILLPASPRLAFLSSRPSIPRPSRASRPASRFRPRARTRSARPCTG